jgi:iron complex outermembrane receptor protein
MGEAVPRHLLPNLAARTRGVELWGSWQATPAWRLSAGYVAQRERFRLEPGSNDAAAVPAYVVADLRLAWTPRPGLELALVARNLCDGGHGEFGAVETRSEIEPAVFASLRWTFDAR